MNRAREIGVAVLVLAAGVFGWWWWRRRAALASVSIDGQTVLADPLGGIVVNGATVSISNVDAIERVQIFEYQGAGSAAIDDGLFYNLGGKDFIFPKFAPGQWWNAFPRQPLNWFSLASVPWSSVWKAKVVTVADSNVHGVRRVPPEWSAV